LDEIYVQGMVHVSSMRDDYYAFDEKQHTLKGENTGVAYRLGDKVEIQVVRVDLERRQLDFALVDVLERAKGRRSGERKLAGPKSARPKAARSRSRDEHLRPAPRGKRAPRQTKRRPRR